MSSNGHPVPKPSLNGTRATPRTTPSKPRKSLASPATTPSKSKVERTNIETTKPSKPQTVKSTNAHVTASATHPNGGSHLQSSQQQAKKAGVDEALGTEEYDITSRIGFEPRNPPPIDPELLKNRNAIVWLDIDNTLYKRSSRIAELMAHKIRLYFIDMGLSEQEATQLHTQYYSAYGLAIRGLVKHHQIDPIDYDNKCDASLPLDSILRPDEQVKRLLSDLDRTKVRVYALTNAYKKHADRVLRLLELQDQVEGIVYCDYAVPDFACKPELDFYKAAMKVVGATPDTKCYFVDDSHLNILAAQQLGWHSCVYFKEEDEIPDATENDKEAAASFDVTVLAPQLNALTARDGFDEEAIKQQFQKLPAYMRIRLLSIILDACLPGDITSMARTLEKHLRLTRDVVSHLPDSVALKIFEKLPIQDLLRCRQVSKKWSSLAATPELWRSHVLALTETDPVKVEPPIEPRGWEPLVKGLFFRERNWAKGIAQRIDRFEGHTGFVTSMKLKGRNTLVTGSYDETIRVWDLSTGVCKKVLKAKAIACLDFLHQEGILCAGLYDSGRVLVWNMKTWELLQTLSGHNRGIRNVAINQDYLVSVGQDKAIVVWDWKTGTKIVRFGQQSNVSLGVSLVDKDKLVAVTVDGVIRCFSIPRKEMIGQFQLTKLGGPDSTLGSKLADLANGNAMLEWFAAHGNTMTVAAKNLVVHLEWQEHIVPIREDLNSPTSPMDVLRRSASSRLSTSGLGLNRTPSQARVRRDSTQSNASTSTPRTPFTPNSLSTPVRNRRDSTASNISCSSPTTASFPGSGRRSMGGNSSSARSPVPPRPPRRSDAQSKQSPSMSRANLVLRKGSSPAPWPLPVGSLELSSPTPPHRSVASPSPILFPTTTPAEDPDASNMSLNSLSETTATRLPPNLSAAPKVVSVLETPDMAIGCVDPSKRRIVCATRFSSRAGANRRLYASTMTMDHGKSSAELAASASFDSKTFSPTKPIQTTGTASTLSKDSSQLKAEASDSAAFNQEIPVDNESWMTVVPIAGAWSAHGSELEIPTRNPMAMVLDHESVVVGCADGFVYRIHFVGCEYGPETRMSVEETDQTMVGHATISDLPDLRRVWKEIFVPHDQPDHPGRLKKRDYVKEIGLK